jgi:hypothetical protein
LEWVTGEDYNQTSVIAMNVGCNGKIVCDPRIALADFAGATPAFFAGV